MPGAGSLVLANWLYNVAPKDGTAFGIIGSGTGFDPLLGIEAAKFDPTRFLWVGSMNNEFERVRELAHLRLHPV